MAVDGPVYLLRAVEVLRVAGRVRSAGQSAAARRRLVVRLEHDRPCEIDEPADASCACRGERARFELLALALRGAVSCTERSLIDLQRVVGHPRERLRAETHQHRVAALGPKPRQRLVA